VLEESSVFIDKPHFVEVVTFLYKAQRLKYFFSWGQTGSIDKDFLVLYFL
jgi:hypothetical protein